MRRTLTTVSGPDVRDHNASGTWQATTLLDVIDRARTNPGGGTVRDSARQLNNVAFLEVVCAAADVLPAAGVTSGDPVMVQLRNSCTYAIADVEISAMGAVCLPVKTSTETVEIEAVAERVGARCPGVSRHRLSDLHAVRSRNARALHGRPGAALPKAWLRVRPRFWSLALQRPARASRALHRLDRRRGGRVDPAGARRDQIAAELVDIPHFSARNSDVLGDGLSPTSERRTHDQASPHQHLL